MKYAVALAAALGLASAAPNNLKTGRRNGARSRVNARNATEPQYSGNWAGVVQEGRGWTKVVGTITVPEVSGQDPNSAASAWVGIDGDSCQTAILQTGVSFYGDGSFDSWYEWIPDASQSFANFDFSAGDQIRMTVDATSLTTGTASLENLSTGASVSHKFSRTPSSLCETDAEWIVEDFEENGSLVPFADFGTVTFTDVSASGSSGSVTAAGGTLIDIRTDQGDILTDCEINGGDLSCKYTGSD